LQHSGASRRLAQGERAPVQSWSARMGTLTRCPSKSVCDPSRRGETGEDHETTHGGGLRDDQMRISGLRVRWISVEGLRCLVEREREREIDDTEKWEEQTWTRRLTVFTNTLTFVMGIAWWATLISERYAVECREPFPQHLCRITFAAMQRWGTLVASTHSCRRQGSDRQLLARLAAVGRTPFLWSRYAQP
jgi:hypothetical protein